MARDYENYSKDALIVHIHELEKQLKNNKYGLYWDKSIAKETVVNQCKAHIPVLHRDCELSLADGNASETHILIEGDNFHALTALNMMCGNEGFVDVKLASRLEEYLWYRIPRIIKRKCILKYKSNMES